MKLAAFNATCPFEIGDKIKTRKLVREDMAARAHLSPATVIEEEHTITDIVCMNYVRSGKTEFLYELDDSGKLVRLEMPPRPEEQERQAAERENEKKGCGAGENGCLLPPEFVAYIKRRFE